MSQGLYGVSQAATERKQERFTALLHHLSLSLLRDSFYALKRQASPGIDRVTWQEYETGLEDRLRDLHSRVHGGAYRARPSRRVYSPKADDKLRSYPAAHREVFPSVRHRSGQYENNGAEVSHRHTKEQERQIRRFKSAAQLQRFLPIHGPIRNLFRVGSHQLRAIHHRLLWERAFTDWKTVTCPC
jgi:hypothetical protein